MSAPARNRGGRFVKVDPLPGAALRDTIPGCRGLPPLTEPVVAGGLSWTAEHCDVWSGSPIGAAWAVEFAARTADSTGDPS